MPSRSLALRNPPRIVAIQTARFPSNRYVRIARPGRAACRIGSIPKEYIE